MRRALIRAMRSMVADGSGHGMRPWRSRLARAPWWLAPAALVLWSACSGPARDPEVALAPGESRGFTGTWSASGSRNTLRLGPDHRVSIVSLTGSLLLTGPRGLGIGFQAEVIGMSDNLTGGQGYCVWTDERGDQVFSELRGGPVGSGSVFVGTITGGTGRYAGLTGEYRFRWKYVIDTEEGVISGRTDDLVGRAQAPASKPAGKTAG
jgi:hypothetical protein